MAENTTWPVGASYFTPTAKDIDDVVRGDVIYLAPGIFRQVWAVSAWHAVGQRQFLLNDGTILTFNNQNDTVRVIEDGA